MKRRLYSGFGITCLICCVFVCTGLTACRTIDSGNSSDQMIRLVSQQQREDGSWTSSSKMGNGQLNDIGTTGLTLLGLGQLGHTHVSTNSVQNGHNIGKTISQGLNSLKEQQMTSGRFGPKEGDWVLNHTLAAHACVSSYGMTGSPRLKDLTQKSINYLAEIQSHQGWSYRKEADQARLVPTVMALMAFYEADEAGLTVPEHVVSKAEQFVRNEIDSTSLNDSSSFLRVSLLTLAAYRLNRDRSKNTFLRNGIKWLSQHPPEPDPSNLFPIYLATKAIFGVDRNQNAYHKWNEFLKERLPYTNTLTDQSRASTVYGTSMLNLIYGQYYRYRYNCPKTL